jgi:hypothetical protein
MSPNTDTTTAVNSEELTSFKLYLPDTGFLYSRISEENFPVSDPIVRKAYWKTTYTGIPCQSGSALVLGV